MTAVVYVYNISSVELTPAVLVILGASLTAVTLIAIVFEAMALSSPSLTLKLNTAYVAPFELAFPLGLITRFTISATAIC